LLVKHPMRHLASFVALRTRADQVEIKTWKKIRRFLAGQSAEDDIIDTYLKNMAWYYESEVKALPSLPGATTLKYEDVILDMRTALSSVLAKCNLEFEEAMAQPFSYSHHQIGGNTGPVYLRSGAWTGDNSLSHEARLRHYENLKASKGGNEKTGLLFLDNKFAKILTERQIDRLIRSKLYRSLCDRLDYEYDPRAK
jgi:hypothetical protein